MTGPQQPPLAPQVAAMPAMQASPVTILDVYTKQVQLDGKLDLINERLQAIPDHEARLRVLEAGRAKLIGAALAVSTVVSAGGTWIGFLATRGH